MRAIIYEPKNQAREYAALACNPYNGCTFGCRYCYASRFSPNGYHKEASPKHGIFFLLERQLDSGMFDPASCPEILLSFQGDVYQPAEQQLCITWRVIDMLIARSLPFTILTKGGGLARRDFTLYEGYGKASFGTSIVFRSQEKAFAWEPNAARLSDRIWAIEEAKNRGIRTWISLEPVIDPDEALKVIEFLHPIVDYWRIGKINHFPEVENRVDWRQFRTDAEALLRSLGADYKFKKSLGG